MISKFASKSFATKATQYARISFADFRSDTVTMPCEKMRDAMANSVVGDEVFGDDLTTNKLNKDIAEILGKEAAIMTTSGTQANLIAMMLIA